MKPGKDFRLSKESKRMILLMKGSSDMRTTWKQELIQAQLIEIRSKNRKVEMPQGDE